MVFSVSIITLTFIMMCGTAMGTQDVCDPCMRGRDGRDGRDGVKGEKGDPGNCTTGCQTELPGPHGPQGPPGIAGSRGPAGEKGLQGPQGEKGTRGDTGLQGPLGMSGMKGMKGDPGIRGGAVYVRWGRTNCSDAIDTELVYSGRAGGTRYDHEGGGANYLCMPDDPDYLQYISGISNRNFVAPVEYQFHTMPTLSQYNWRNVPCAVCYVATRGTVLMIPAKTQCPTNWTREYYGYLMSEYRNHRRTMYECIDKDPESITGLNADSDPRALFYTNEAYCSGFSCPPYSSEKELTCAVCTR